MEKNDGKKTKYVDVLDEDEIVDEFLRVCYYNIKNWKVEQTYNIFKENLSILRFRNKINRN